MTKEELRKAYLEKRRALSETELAALSAQLCKEFFTSVELSTVRVLHTFLPIKKNKEPDTFRIIERIRKEYSSIRLSLPRINDHNSQMENYFWNDSDALLENKWGIPEPAPRFRTPTEMIDLVLVPLLACDVRGNRVGYGKGFYDRFLASCKKSCRKVGLSLFPPVDEIIVGRDHDQRLDQLVTPEKNYSFNF